MENYPEMRGKWDIAKLPKCPDPMSGDGRATMSNGLCYSTGAHGKQLEAALDVIKFFGTEEAQRIQGENGAAIPTYLGTEETWRSAFDSYDEKLDLVQRCAINGEFCTCYFCQDCVVVNRRSAHYASLLRLILTGISGTLFTVIYAMLY